MAVVLAKQSSVLFLRQFYTKDVLLPLKDRYGFQKSIKAIGIRCIQKLKKVCALDNPLSQGYSSSVNETKLDLRDPKQRDY